MATKVRTHRYALIVLSLLLVSYLALPLCSRRRQGSSYPGARPLDRGAIEFHDGDSFRYRGENFRLLGIDCPEIANPGVGIDEDQPYGKAAAETTRALILRARSLEYVPDGPDTYGRRLVHVFVDGRLLSVLLLERALAYETVSHFGDNGFPDLADSILTAAARGPKPRFSKPYLWRRRHQRRRRGER